MLLQASKPAMQRLRGLLGAVFIMLMMPASLEAGALLTASYEVATTEGGGG